MKSYMHGLAVAAFVPAMLLCKPACAADPAGATSCAQSVVQEGCGRLTWPDGSFYSGTFHKGIFDGNGVVTFADGSRLEGEFQDGILVGEATFTSVNGSKIHGRYHDVSIDRTQPHRPMHYPFWRGVLGSEASLMIATIVGSNGTVRDAFILTPSPFESFNDEAVAGVKQWRYEPATVDGHAVTAPSFVFLEFNNGR